MKEVGPLDIIVISKGKLSFNETWQKLHIHTPFHSRNNDVDRSESVSLPKSIGILF